MCPARRSLLSPRPLVRQARPSEKRAAGRNRPCPVRDKSAETVRIPDPRGCKKAGNRRARRHADLETETRLALAVTLDVNVVRRRIDSFDRRCAKRFRRRRRSALTRSRRPASFAGSPVRTLFAGPDRQGNRASAAEPRIPATASRFRADSDTPPSRPRCEGPGCRSIRSSYRCAVGSERRWPEKGSCLHIRAAPGPAGPYDVVVDPPRLIARANLADQSLVAVPHRELRDRDVRRAMERSRRLREVGRVVFKYLLDMRDRDLIRDLWR